jgi:bidirectional [NiFe] hydrogenase diaphorase subunit
MHHLLNKILERKATARDLQKLEELCDMVKNTSLCGLGQTAPNPVLSTLRFFRKEYTDLLVQDTYGPKNNGQGNGQPQSVRSAAPKTAAAATGK